VTRNVFLVVISDGSPSQFAKSPDSADRRTLPLSPMFVRISVPKNLRCPPNVALHKRERRAQTLRHLLFDIVNHKQSALADARVALWVDLHSLCKARPVRRNAGDVRMTSERGLPARIRPATKKCGRGRPRSDVIVSAASVVRYDIHGRNSPCLALFFDMGIQPRVKESHTTRRFPACARALEKCVALLFALLAGRA